MSTESEIRPEDLAKAKAQFQDIDAGTVMDAVARLGHITENFFCEYGPRDDGAMVYHFYAPMGCDWDESYKMDKRLSRAIAEELSDLQYQGSFAEELQSFAVIVHGAMRAPDPYALARDFLASIEKPLEDTH